MILAYSEGRVALSVIFKDNSLTEQIHRQFCQGLPHIRTSSSLNLKIRKVCKSANERTTDVLIEYKPWSPRQ